MVAWDLLTMHLTPKGKPRTKVVIVNHKSQNNMHCVLYCHWFLLLLVNTQHIVYIVKQCCLQLCVVYEKDSTTSCQHMDNNTHLLLYMPVCVYMYTHVGSRHMQYPIGNRSL